MKGSFYGGYLSKIASEVYVLVSARSLEKKSTCTYWSELGGLGSLTLSLVDALGSIHYRQVLEYDLAR